MTNNYFKASEFNPRNHLLPKETEKNLQNLIFKLNILREAYGRPMILTSGYRTPEEQKKINPSAPNSKHCLGLAVDVSDNDSVFMNWILKNLNLAKELDLFFEDFRYTPNWCHIQVGKPKSGKRIFKPNNNPALCNRWDGKYDKKLDAF